jgi:uncharacterized protein (TIGR03067 family)
MRGVLLLACGLVFGASLVGVRADMPAQAEKDLQGTWVAVSAERDGKAADDVVGHRLSFAGGRFEIHSRDGKLLYQGTFEAFPNQKPAAIDFKHSAGPLKGKVWKGIYSIEDGALKTCDNAPDLAKDRPREFSARAGSGHVAIVFKRKAKFTIDFPPRR